MTLRRTEIGCLLIAVALGAACTTGHDEPLEPPYQPLVFPGEARAGASAMMVIDSNFQLIDSLERYDLHRDRVKIVADDAGTPITITPRSVFTVESGRTAANASAHDNPWVTVALFDLPALGGPYPRHVPLGLEVDGVAVPELEGVIVVRGSGGVPTGLNDTPVSGLIEDLLEPTTTVRLRAREVEIEGVGPAWTGWTIGSISAAIRFDPDCLSNPRVATNTDAFEGGAFLGAPTGPDGAFEEVELFFTHPGGFVMPLLGTDRVGEGPILDILFDRTQDPSSCAAALDSYVRIHGLRVTGLDGSVLLARPSPPDLGSDSSEFFHLHYVDPDQPQ